MRISKVLISVIIVMCLLMISLACAANNAYASDRYYTGCAMNVTLVNQNPYPAQPNSYVEVVFQVSWMQNYVCNGSRFELVTDYPFSLDSQSALRILPDDTYIQGYKKDWMVPYKLRVDKDALNGEAEIEVRYSPGIWNSTSMTKKFNITIEDARTIFDAVIQEISGSDVSIAIANAGKYTANSVVVRIPEQENFAVSGSDGQMVGNLESGDYTVVAFSLTQKANPPFGESGTFSRQDVEKNASAGTRTLKFDIHYTDNIGVRRVVNMELPFGAVSAVNTTTQFTRAGSMPAARTSTKASGNGASLALIITAVACMAIVSAAYIIYRRKAKAKEKKQTGTSNDEDVPAWMKNVKSKGKK